MDSKNKTLLIAALVLIVILVAGFVVAKSMTPVPLSPEDNATTTPPAGQSMTLEGTVICLPHKDTTGPQTLECALGLEGDNGNNYGLRMNASSTPENLFSFPGGTHIAVSGTFTPVEALPDTTLQKYDIVGVIEVDTAQETE